MAEDAFLCSSTERWKEGLTYLLLLQHLRRRGPCEEQAETQPRRIHATRRLQATTQPAAHSARHARTLAEKPEHTHLISAQEPQQLPFKNINIY